jgi:hypothetical protein
MKTSKFASRIAVLALVAAAASGLVVACSGDDNSSPQPTVDGGNTSDVTMTGDDSSMSSETSITTDGNGSTDALGAIDTGSCKSDAGTCNSCYSSTQAGQDPYNACTPYTKNCVKFDSTRVPSHPTL